MKKILTTLASVTLLTGSVSSITAWNRIEQNQNVKSQKSNDDAAVIADKLDGKTIVLDGTYWIGKDIAKYHQQLADTIVKQGLLTKEEVQYVSWNSLMITASKDYKNLPFTVKKDGATDVAHVTLEVAENPQEITNKLNGKTVKLDPTFWLNKNLAECQQDMAKVLVKEGLLTAYEAQYVHWSNFTVAKAGYYWNDVSFYASKGGPQYGAYGKVTIDASTGETTKQIATKIVNANIKFNFNYWNTKALQDYLPEFRNILVNEKVLTKAEASVVSGIVSPVTITKAGTVDVNVDVNDNNTNTDADTHINVLNDGDSAAQIASGINGYGLGLKTNTAGMYADSSYVLNNVRNLLVANYGQTVANMNNVTLPHVLLNSDTPNVNAVVTKDGQIVNAKLDLECKTGPYNYVYSKGSPIEI